MVSADCGLFLAELYVLYVALGNYDTILAWNNLQKRYAPQGIGTSKEPVERDWIR